MLYGNSFGGIAVSLASAVALVFAIESPGIEGFQHNWLMAMVALLTFRCGDALYWRAKRLTPEFSIESARWRFVVAASITGVMWGFYAAMVVTHVSPLELAVLVAILAAMAGGATTVLAAERHLAAAYAMALLVPPSLQMLLVGETLHYWLGGLGLVFAVVMVVSARKVGGYTRDAIWLKNQNADLLAQMEVEQQAVKTANADLEHKVQQRTQKIYELSNLDPLTGLLSRNAFSQQAGRMLERTVADDGALALLFIDLDGFKGINDALGHHVGDQVLRLVAERLRQALLPDAILCRWGGDEFIVALPEAQESDATLVAQALIDRLSQSYRVELHNLSVGATVGIALYPEHGNDIDQLIGLADMAMYVQKKQLKSATRVFSYDLQGELVREQALRDGLAQALVNDEFTLVYQPILDIECRRVVAVEALLRWRHDDQWVAPDEFIAIAERYGLIHRMGDWVLDKACHFGATQLPPDIAICVNVSMLELMRDDYVEQVHMALARHDMSPNNLHLEITESVFAQDSDVINTNLARLSGMGVQVAIDDFGTGFSSLSLLQSLNVDYVKIDRSFLSSYHNGGRAIIQATQHIAKEFGYDVVVEGVETQAQVELLQAMGQVRHQGYFYARPMAASTLLAWLSKWSAQGAERLA